MDHFKIRSAMGSEYEFTDKTPSSITFEKFPGSDIYFVHGSWGHMVFQHLKGIDVAAWYSQYFLNCAVELVGSANEPVTELHSSIENYFINDWDGIGLPTERAGQGGFSHAPFVNNKAFFPQAALYRTFDFHYRHNFFLPYVNAYPKLYELINHAERKEPNQIDEILNLDADLKSIINQIKKFDHKKFDHQRYFQIKAEEFLIGALDRMHPIEQKREFTLTPILKEKAEHLESILKVRFAEPLSLAEISQMLTTNVQSIGVAFKQRFGMTIFQYIHVLKLEKGKEMLIDSPSLDLETIAIRTGLYDASRFSKAFKRKYDVSPGGYRSAGKEKE